MRDIVKGFIVGLVSLASIFIMMISNIYLQDYIKAAGGLVTIFLLAVSYLLAYTWPILMAGTIIWSIRLGFKLLTRVYPRLLNKIIFIHIKY